MESLGFVERLILAWVVYFRVLFDGRLAARVRAATAGELPAAPTPEALPAPPVKQEPPAQERDLSPALQLLALLQERGRLVDFLQEDITTASDAEVGVAARVVHEGCRKVLAERAKVSALRAEEEGAEVIVPAGYAPAEIKLVGELRGEAPFRGLLRHRGWRADDFTLPVPIAGHRAEILAPAEVEL